MYSTTEPTFISLLGQVYCIPLRVEIKETHYKPPALAKGRDICSNPCGLNVLP